MLTVYQGPDGFVGRAFTQRQSAEPGLPQRLVDWNEEDVLIALARRFELPVPPPGAPLQWESARVWAERFWARAAADEQISPGFRQICEENRENLEKAGTGPRLIV